MITSSFDTSKPIVTPSSFYKKSNFCCDTCIVTFSKKILSYVIKNYSCKTAGSLPVYVFDYKGKHFATYLSPIGAPIAAAHLLGANQIVGAANFIVFGSAGSLDKAITSGRYIIPTQAYRDEGLSYHYVQASDYIDIKTAKTTASFFSSKNLPFTEGRVWTTDALFMETENKAASRKAEGCLAVDMELSALEAVCDYHNFNLYYFLETGDVLCTDDYTNTGSDKANHHLTNFDIALDLAYTL